LEALHEHIESVEQQLHNLERRAHRHPEAFGRERPARRAEEMEEHARELVRRREELIQRAHHMEQELEHIHEDRPEARENLEVELHAIHERAKAIDRELEELERPFANAGRRTVRTTRPRGSDVDDQVRALTRRILELRAQATQADRELERTDDRGGEKARDLQAHIEELHAHMRNAEKELHALRTRRADAEREREPGERTPDRREPRARATRGGGWEQVHAGLLEHIRLTEEKLKNVDNQDGPTASRLRRVLEQLHQRREAAEREVEQSGGMPRRQRERGIEGEVEELRGRVNGMHEEMTHMRRLLERLLEQRAEEDEEVQEVREHR
jgi:chromosome segregation ATPase